MKLGVLLASACAVVILCLADTALAQRELHWDSVDVDATLDAAGHLRVSETQTMVFSGEWNGGERHFNIRPRQKLSFIGLYRADGGGWRELTENAGLADVDDFAWTEENMLRWRSRRSTDPPFANTPITYQLRYELSGILLKNGDEFLLDHDFVFPEREGAINRFTLRLTLDRTWQPKSVVPEVYTAERLSPGRGFVVTLPLQYSGAGVPSTLDTSRPPAIVNGVSSLIGLTGVAIAWLFLREQSNGRFAPLSHHVDDAWLREHIFKYDAEVVGAAWDEGISSPEVVALIARMVSEGKLESEVGSGSSMALRLNVDRNTLEGHERALVEGLFFNGRVKTNTELVKEHYRSEGFNPANTIRRELETRVEAALPAGRTHRRLRFASSVLWLAGCGLLLIDWYAGNIPPLGVALIAIGTLVTIGIAKGLGRLFRARIHWGRRAALACLTPALVAVAGTATFLWYYAGLGIVDLPSVSVLAIVALALSVVVASTDAMTSRRHRAAIAFRKSLAAGRAFFMTELGKEQPALRDEWFPWILAFGLGRQVDRWSTRHSGSRRDSRGANTSAFSSSTTFSSGTEPPSPQWTGFSGGRSGGAGGGASWASAAGGLAAGVSPPSSSGSSSNGGSSSSSSGSSGSSGGGGGGGW